MSEYNKYDYQSEGVISDKNATAPEKSQDVHRPLIVQPPVSERIEYIEGGEGVQEMMCRNCLGGIEEGNDFIAPCACKGSMKWVHRHCLDQWRVMSPNPKSFYRCENCHFYYEFRLMERIWQFLVAICSCIVLIADNGFVLHAWMFGENFPKVLGVYILGNLLFLFSLGVIGIVFGFSILVMKCFGCMGGNEQRSVSYNNISYRHSSGPHFTFLDYFLCWYMCNHSGNFWSPYYGFGYGGPVLCCPDRNCGGCHGGGNVDCFSNSIGNCDFGGGDDAGGILVVIGVIAIIVVIIIICVGAVIGIALLIFGIYTIMNRRIYIIKRKDDCKKHYVLDLEHKRMAEEK